jgi:hypothetical protein
LPRGLDALAVLIRAAAVLAFFLARLFLLVLLLGFNVRQAEQAGNPSEGHSEQGAAGIGHSTKQVVETAAIHGEFAPGRYRACRAVNPPRGIVAYKWSTQHRAKMKIREHRPASHEVGSPLRLETLLPTVATDAKRVSALCEEERFVATIK